MSRSIWTRCAGSSRAAPLALAAWRAVESQTVVSTRKLVDSDDEQAVLEELIDRVKPPSPPGPEFRGLHFLLATPFRHPPLRHGSRFGTRAERGIWYGARELATVFAEVAYYRLVFLDGTAADLGTIAVELSAFRCQVRTRHGVDLTVAPFAAYRKRISDPSSYGESQDLGREMRAGGVEAFLYFSARDPEGGAGIGLLAPAFGRRRPSVPEAWICHASRDKVEIAKKDVFVRRRLRFPREVFAVGGRLPAPAV
jgi:RES domain